MKRMFLLLTLVLVFLAFFLMPLEEGVPDQDSPRGRFNAGVNALSNGELDTAETLLLEARDKAGTDAVLRVSAAYNLGLSLAMKGRALERDGDLQNSMDAYSKAASWFQDTIRLDESDVSARKNLEVVLKRIQLLNDKLNQGVNRLEARLERLLTDTRSLLDDSRALSIRITEAGDGADPSGRRSEFESLAIQARTLQSDASTALQRSNEEQGSIESKLETERTEDEKVRLAQLKSLNLHLNDGRDHIANARRTLRRLDIDSSLQALIDAVQGLVRAIEQLADPLAVLKTVAGEEQQLLKQSAALAMIRAQATQLGSSEDVPKLPTWFDGAFLAKTQSGLHERCNEVLQRFQIVAEGQAQTPTDSDLSQTNEMSQLIIDAIPPLMDAVDAMKSAEADLANEKLQLGLQHEQAALSNLALAIERFADARTLIELSHETQLSLVNLTQPQNNQESDDTSMTNEEKIEALTEQLTQNIGRMKRLSAALEREKEKQLAAVQQASEGQSPESNPTEQVDALFEMAETHRKTAATALDEMNSHRKKDLEPESDNVPEEGDRNHLHSEAEKALEAIKELRILFFSIVQHLQDLLEKQNQTRDQTVAVSTGDYDMMLQELLTLTPRQEEHAVRAQALLDALREQADAAQAAATQQGQAAGAGQPDPAQQAEALQTAALEVSLAQGFMEDAMDTMVKVQSESGEMSHELGPAADEQELAIEALQRALEALQPPQDQNGEDQEQQDDQVEKQEAERRLQEAKEREAQRQKDKNQNAGATEPVERDW